MPTMQRDHPSGVISSFFDEGTNTAWAEMYSSHFGNKRFELPVEEGAAPEPIMVRLGEQAFSVYMQLEREFEAARANQQLVTQLISVLEAGAFDHATEEQKAYIRTFVTPKKAEKQTHE